jgi:hypothetical protein
MTLFLRSPSGAIHKMIEQQLLRLVPFRHHLRMPLNRKNGGMRRRFDGFHNSIVRTCRYYQSISQTMNGLMVKRIDRESVFSYNSMQLTSRYERDLVCGLPFAELNMGMKHILSERLLQVLMQAAAHRHIEQLQSSAYAEYWHVPGERTIGKL